MRSIEERNESGPLWFIQRLSFDSNTFFLSYCISFSNQQSAVWVEYISTKYRSKTVAIRIKHTKKEVFFFWICHSYIKLQKLYYSSSSYYIETITKRIKRERGIVAQSKSNTHARTDWTQHSNREYAVRFTRERVRNAVTMLRISS